MYLSESYLKVFILREGNLSIIPSKIIAKLFTLT